MVLVSDREAGRWWLDHLHNPDRPSSCPQCRRWYWAKGSMLFGDGPRKAATGLAVAVVLLVNMRGRQKPKEQRNHRKNVVSDKYGLADKLV